MSNVVLIPWEDVKGFLKEGQTSSNVCFKNLILTTKETSYEMLAGSRQEMKEA